MHFCPCTPARPTLKNAHAAVPNGERNGVIAQMGERLNGIQEVGSSILPGSTKLPNDYNALVGRPLGRPSPFSLHCNNCATFGSLRRTDLRLACTAYGRL